MPFETKLHVVEVDDGATGQWKLHGALLYRGAKDSFVIPAGFVTDFASVPRAFWSTFPPYGKHTKAAVVHDWLYVVGVVSREDADGIFLRIMKELGVSWWRRYTMHRAVRAFGWAPWAKYRKLEK